MHPLAVATHQSTHTRRAALGLSVGLALVMLFLFDLVGLGGRRSQLALQPAVAAPRVITPTLTDVSPGAAPNNLDVTLVLTGTGFQPTPTVSLDGFVLPSVGWVTTSSLTGTVPWGLNAGVYTVTVTNPDGRAASLTRALTIERAIGVWTTGGPYGGHVETVVVHPQISTTVFAIASDVGLFRSTDGATSWHSVQPPSDQVHALALKPGSPDTMLVGSSQGLFRSLDRGSSWQHLLTATIGPVAYAPSAPERVYVVADNAFRTSEDGGDSWDPPGGDLPEASSRAIAVHPVTDTLVLMGAEDGRIFRTEDAGTSWQELPTSLPTETVRTLRFDPLAPNRVYAIGWHDGSMFHRSRDGGVNWESMMLGSLQEKANDLAFHPTVSGTVYAMSCLGVYSSTNAGDTWTLVADVPLDCMWAVALDPAAGVPLYGGGGTRGVLRSPDGGRTWHRAAEGMNALQPVEIAASRTHPEQIYVAASSAGSFASADAGRSWRLAVSGDWIDIGAAAADPVQSCVGYLGSWGPGLEPNTGVGYVYETTDCGQTWETHLLPGTPSVGETVFVVAADPHDPDTLFAGGVRGSSDPDDVGMVYSSTNGGVSWAEVDVGHPLSQVVSIAFDPLVSGTLYVGTGTILDPGGLSYLPTGAVYKSTDGGASWHVRSDGLSGLPIEDIVVDPSDSDVLYAAVYEDPDWSGEPTDRSGVFKSEDGGLTWYATNAGLGSHNLTTLFIDPLEARTVYAGTRWDGLYRSTDAGATWSRASGPFGYAPIFSLSGGSKDERTFIYVGTAGGVVTGATTAHSESDVAAQHILGAGVYQQTIDHRPQPTIYLPLVLKLPQPAAP